MRRENHRRRGVFRASSGGWGHRAVYVGAIIASVAMVGGFGSAVLIYGPLGVPLHQLPGSTLTYAPPGVVFGNASVALASQMAGMGWNWTYNATTHTFDGPCSLPGVFNASNGTYFNQSTAPNNTVSLSVGGGNTTVVCLNSVNNGFLNSTWSFLPNGTAALSNSYNATNWVPNGSFYSTDGIGNTSSSNITSCNNATTLFGYYNTLNYTFYTGTNGTYIPCDTYWEMNNNTTFLTSMNGVGGANNTSYNGTTLWSPNQTGYAPGDIIYQVPVVFENDSVNGTYAISIDIEGVTPVAQTFYFNNTIGNTTLANDTVVFTFDMTAAWLVDLTLNGSYNVTSAAIYGSVGVVSAIVTECASSTGNVAVCPLATPVI